MKKDIKNKKLPNKEQKKDELTDKELKDISGGGYLDLVRNYRAGKISKEEYLRGINGIHELRDIPGDN